jgi:hypothetical protein
MVSTVLGMDRPTIPMVPLLLLFPKYFHSPPPIPRLTAGTWSQREGKTNYGCPERLNANIFVPGESSRSDESSGPKRRRSYIWRTEAAGVKLHLLKFYLRSLLAASKSGNKLLHRL